MWLPNECVMSVCCRLHFDGLRFSSSTFLHLFCFLFWLILETLVRDIVLRMWTNHTLYPSNVQWLRFKKHFHRMLYASFLEEMYIVVDIQFMGKGCYHLEFTDPSSVDRLLKIKHTSLHGSRISFYRWTHNVVADAILQHKEVHMIFTVIFPGLKKEWHQVLAQIVSLLVIVIAIKDKASQEDDCIWGALAVRVLAPRNNVLPSSVLLPNLQENKELLPQRIIYQMLMDQRFICRHLGLLGRIVLGNIADQRRPLNRLQRWGDPIGLQ